MHRQILNITLVILLVSCISCGNKAGEIGFGPPEREIGKLYNRADAAYNRLAEKRIRNSLKNWENVIQQFDEIVKDYPKSGFADDAQYKIGSCYIQMYGLIEDSPQKAITAFEYLIDRYPDSEFVDDAYYWKAHARSLEGNYEVAVEEYEAFISKYPNSELRAEAVSRMAEHRARLGGEEKSQPEEPPAPAVKETQVSQQPPVEKTISDSVEVPDQDEETHSDTVKESDLSTEEPIDLSKHSHIKDIRFQSTPEFTRIVVELSGPVEYKNGKLKDPDRFYVDLWTAVVTPAKQTITVNDEFIDTIRVAQFDEDTARIVLDFKQIQNCDIFYLRDPDRLVMDIHGAESVSIPPPESPPAHSEESVPLVKQLGLKVKTIVIDPGHGGKDPGTVSKSDTHEKSLVLDVSMRLKELLESRGCYQVYLTRETDVFIPLGERTKFANEKGADIFISIHINASERAEAQGIETYYLSLASDEEARATAALENASAGKTISDLSGMLRHILRGAKVDESRELARTIQSRLCYHTGATDRGVRRAPFIVLIGAEAPSVLVEMGFMSNAQDESLLCSVEYRQKLARALMEAVESYVRTID